MDEASTALATGSTQPSLNPPGIEAPSVLATLSRLSSGQIMGLGLTLIGLLGFFAYLTFRIVEPDYQLLYGGLDLEDSAEIISRLESQGVPYKMHAGGESVLVPADRVARLRMSMAEEGLPRGGSVGDEIFDQAGALGTTTFLANINQRRALEGELSRTIAALKDVKAARVHLVLPKRELFRRDQIEPSASVTLRMFGGHRLEPRQVSAVQHLVAAAVPGLQPDRVTLVDDRGTLLVRGGDGGMDGGLSTQADSYRIAHEARLKRVIEQLLERSLGPGRVHAEVNADMDFDQVSMTEETFDPDGQVVRSTQSIEEETELAEQDRDGTVTVGNNLPNTNAAGEGGGRTNNENTVRTEETVNYEISRTVRNHTQVGGRIKRLSVAVLVGGRDVVVGDGSEPTYAPLELEELDEIASLVRSAIGFDAERGDTIEVKNMPFVEPAVEEIESSLFNFTKSDLFRLAELGALVLLALIATLMIVRPALKQLAPNPVTLSQQAAAQAGQSSIDQPGGGGNLPSVLDEHGRIVSVNGANSAAAADGEGAGPAALDSSAAFADVSAGLIQDVRNVVEARPDEAVAIVRHWMENE
ncbi:MAG: flagellar basal-body MS-ring/collar protein FliF [Geminicoccaceae bacterium]